MANEKRTRTANLVVGIFVLVFFVIGVVSTVSLIAGRMKKASDNGSRLREYESFIYPVVMNDPDTFDDVSKAQQDQLIAISIWSILQSNLETDKYTYSEKGMLIPKKDVEEAFEKLFGSEVKVSHTSTDGGGIEFRFSEKKGQYIIPITGITPLYTPTVLEANEKNDFVTLLVGYLSGDDWEQDENGNPVKPEPSKYVRIILRKTGENGYCVSALRSADAP